MGLCHEFGSQINASCDHPMRAGASACSCPECGVVCQGLFDGCADVWARGPRPVTISATRLTATATASPVSTISEPAAQAAEAPAAPEEEAQPVRLNPQTSRRANGIRGNRARVQAAASFGRSDLPTTTHADDPRREMFRWFEDAFVGVRSDLQTLIASMTHQQAMLAELIDNRHAELRLVLAAETLPDVVAEAVASAMKAHTEAMTESFTAALGTFSEEIDKTQATTATSVDKLRESFDTFLEALATHDAGAEKREAARLRALKAAVTRQMAPVTEAMELLNAQGQAGSGTRRAAAPPPEVERKAKGAADAGLEPAQVAPTPRPAAARPARDVTGPKAQPARSPRAAAAPPVQPAGPARSPRVVTGAQAKGPASARSPRVVTGPQVKQVGRKAGAAKPIPPAVGDKSPLLRTIRSSQTKT